MPANGMAKAYDPTQVETRWYREWEDRGYFHGNSDSNKAPYTIVIPPPNVTGVLTLGHVLNNTLQDILVRWEKMRGKEICWVPGTDHAGIATQSKVEAYLRDAECVTRYDLGRDEFLERVWQWKKKYGGTIIKQLRSLGVACDWRRERFTLDEGLSNAVSEVFIRLYNKGLIYKGTRMINWCPKSRTALSDEEVVYQKNSGSLWYIKYPLSNGADNIIVATTRPETMLGDTGVAVHPEDERYQRFIGQTARLPLTNREIPVFADHYVDKEFGTGAVKVTPAHDPNDYDMGIRHDLKVINVMNDDGSMNEHAGSTFQGLDRYECRRKVIEMLSDQGLLEETESYEHQVGYSERGHVPVEPRLSTQWFVKMDTLAQRALHVVDEGRIRFHPEKWIKTYNHWLENIKDWCISRQLWWGHRIPAYYCCNCSTVVVSKSLPASCPSCNHTQFRQDEDVLDTWFSSWLWPFSVFGWPEESQDLSHFYPTQSLVTGPDIIFFWVARMIMAGLEFMGDIPFSNVYFTSIIRDEQGRKLSKSLNNSPDPLDVIKAYGADALRFTVIYIAPVGQDIRYSNEKCEIGRNFANKIWNVARFRQIQGEIAKNWNDLDGLTQNELRPDDRWVLNRMNDVIATVTESLSNFNFHSYALQLYDFVWSEFCDWYVESAKAAFYGDDQRLKCSILAVFDFVFSRILRLAHPVMPFVTEEIYHHLGYTNENDSVMLAPWPQAFGNAFTSRLGLTSEIATLVEEKFDLIKAGRNLRGTYNIPFTKKIVYIIKPTNNRFNHLLEEDTESTRMLLNASAVDVDPEFAPDNSIPSAVGKLGLVFMPLAGAIDIEQETRRLTQQMNELRGLIEQTDRKLMNEKFLTRAPEEVVSREREKRKEYSEKLQQVKSLLGQLK